MARKLTLQDALRGFTVKECGMAEDKFLWFEVSDGTTSKRVLYDLKTKRIATMNNGKQDKRGLQISED